MVFRLVEAQLAWRRLDGGNQLPKVILGVKFADGLGSLKSRRPLAGQQPPRLVRSSPKMGDSSTSAGTG